MDQLRESADTPDEITTKRGWSVKDGLRTYRGPIYIVEMVASEEISPWLICGYHAEVNYGGETMTIRNHLSQGDQDMLQRQGILKKVIADGFYQEPVSY